MPGCCNGPTVPNVYTPAQESTARSRAKRGGGRGSIEKEGGRERASHPKGGVKRRKEQLEFHTSFSPRKSILHVITTAQAQ